MKVIVDEAEVLSQVALMFPHERSTRLLRTVIAWVRYAELFKYNSKRKVIYKTGPVPVQP